MKAPTVMQHFLSIIRDNTKTNSPRFKLYITLTMFQTLIVWVQQEVLKAVRDVMIGQELQIILIKLKLQRMLLQNLQRYEKTDKDSQRGRKRRSEKVRVCMTAGLCAPRVRLWLYIPPAHKWPIRNRKEPLLSSWGQRSVISSPPDTIETEPAGLQLHCSHPWCDESNGREVLNIWGHLGLLAKTTAVLEMRQFYFQLLSESPSLLLFIDPLTPKTPAKQP